LLTTIHSRVAVYTNNSANMLRAWMHKLMKACVTTVERNHW